MVKSCLMVREQHAVISPAYSGLFRVRSRALVDADCRQAMVSGRHAYPMKALVESSWCKFPVGALLSKSALVSDTSFVTL